MAERSVSIRLGTTGEAQVKRVFTEIGDAGDAAAKRYARSFDKATDDVEAAMRRQAAAAKKMEVFMPGLNPTKLDMYAGVQDGVRKSAQESAAPFIAYYEQMERRAASLTAALDPLYAAQQRYNREMAEAKGLLDAGVLSHDIYQKKLQVETAELDRVAKAQGRVGGETKRSGTAFAQAAPQIQDFVIQATMGGNVMQALVVQGGQLAGQLVYVEGKVGAVARAFMGPWGVAAQVALMVLAPFVAKLSEGSDEAEKLKNKVTSLADALGKEKFGTEAATKALREYNEAKVKASDVDSLAIDQSLSLAEARLKEAVALRETIKAQMDKALLDEGAARGLGGGALLAVVNNGSGALQAQEDRIKLLNETLANLYVDKSAQAEKLVGRVAAINNQYDRQRDAAIRAARGNVELSKSLAATRQEIERNRQAALKAEQERQQAANSTKRDMETLTSARVAKALRDEFAGIHITSADRSTSKQAELYARYKAGLGPLAAPPGTSYHEKGQAIDVAKSSGITREALQRFFDLRGIQAKIIDEGRHLHVQWQKGKFALDEWADSAKRATEEGEQLEKIRLFTLGTSNIVAVENALASLSRQAEDTARKAREILGINGDPLAEFLGAANDNQRQSVEQRRDEISQMVQRQRYDIQSLAGLYQNLFTGGTRSIWDTFKQQGLQIISELLARWTLFGNLKGAFGQDGIDTGIFGAIGRLFGGGGATSFDMTKTNAMLDNIIVPKFGVGTAYAPGGWADVGEFGKERLWLPRGTRVSSARETQSMMAGNDNRPSVTNNYFSGNLMTPEFWAQIQAGDDMAATRGAAGGAMMGQAEMRAQGARRLGRSW